MTAGSITLVASECPVCAAHTAIPVGTDDYLRWQAGVLVQDAFPYLSAADRERLMTGYCDDCWDRLWGDDDG